MDGIYVIARAFGKETKIRKRKRFFQNFQKKFLFLLDI